MFLGLNKRARHRSSCRKQAAAAATVAKLIKKFDYQDFNLHFFSLSPTPGPVPAGKPPRSNGRPPVRRQDTDGITY